MRRDTSLPTPAHAPLSALAHPTPAAAAAAYAALGLAVFPAHTVDGNGCCSCGTECGRNAGKHPRTTNGLLAASCDADQVRAWWQRWPDANVAVATGAASGVCVLDVDPAHGGLESIEVLEADHGCLSPTWCVETGGDGLHLWFLLENSGLRNSAGRLGPGLDVRANGGYVIVPPSRHRSGIAYQWAPTWHPTLVDLAPAPPWLVILALHAPPNKMIPPDDAPIGTAIGGNHFAPATRAVAHGARNATLTSLAGAMRRKGCGERAIVAALLVENVERCEPPLTEAEIATIAHSVCRYAPENPPRLVRPVQRGKAFVQFIDGKAVAQ